MNNGRLIRLITLGFSSSNIASILSSTNELSLSLGLAIARTVTMIKQAKVAVANMNANTAETEFPLFVKEIYS
jgi:hypothetical protein